MLARGSLGLGDAHHEAVEPVDLRLKHVDTRRVLRTEQTVGQPMGHRVNGEQLVGVADGVGAVGDVLRVLEVDHGIRRWRGS